jgi:hypothetical protein
MKPYKKNKVVRTTTYRKEYNVISRGWDDPYLDECWSTHRYSGTYRHKRKVLYEYQVRMYKTWKHNRKTQWK